MIFTDLIQKFSEEYSINVLSSGIAADIIDVAFIDGKHASTAPGTLYFGYDKQLTEDPSLPCPLPHQCVIAGTSAQIPVLSGNIALVPESSLFSLFNDVKAFIASIHSKGIYEELTALAYKTRSIEEVIDAASVLLGVSLLFCDMNFKILASSTTIPVLDPIWVENVKQGYCCYDFICEIKELPPIKNAAKTIAATEVSCKDSPNRKLSCKVFHKQKQVGFLLLIEGQNPIAPSHFEMLSTISQVISYTIAYYTPYLFEENTPYRELLYDLLIGAPSRDVHPRIESLHFPAKMIAAFVSPPGNLSRQDLKNVLYKKLRTQVPGIHATFHKNGIAAVLPVTEEAPSEQEQLEILKSFSREEHVKIGTSHPFESIEGFAAHFEQAYSALTLGLKLDAAESFYVYRYQDYQIFGLFASVAHPGELENHRHPALPRLRQYDQKSSSQLYKTLLCFIENGCSIKLASQALFIHRNSLIYRLNRINELCHIDFSDTNTLFLLRLSFLIDRYNGVAV